MHVWPVAAKMPEIAPLTASSSPASSKTMFGLLPPSSRLTRFMPRAVALSAGHSPAPKARCAACTARSASSASPRGISAHGFAV